MRIPDLHIQADEWQTTLSLQLRNHQLCAPGRSPEVKPPLPEAFLQSCCVHAYSCFRFRLRRRMM